MSDLVAVLDEITTAFTNKDVDAFGAHLEDSFTWFNPDGSVFTPNRTEFLKIAVQYWTENPNLKSNLSSPIIVGNMASQTEVVSGFEDGHTESYLWVYEFNANGKLAKQWGFIPAA